MTKPRESESLPPLLPCPRCGKAPTYAMTQSFDAQGDRRAHEVLCYACKLYGAESESVSAAYDAWNELAKQQIG